MKLAPHLMEPWLIKNQDVPYNLGESGMVDMTLKELLEVSGVSHEELLKLSFKNIDTRGSLPLRKAIASFYGDIDPDTILVTTGTSEAIYIYYSIRYEPGANVVVPFPAFQTLYEVPRHIGFDVRLLPLRKENQFIPDLDELRSLVDSNTKVIVVNTPHNPTGQIYSEEIISGILKIAEESNAEVLADEHYRFINYSDAGILPSLYGRSPRVIGAGSMIKCFGCVGLRAGWIIGPKQLIDDARDFKDYTTHTLCSINDYLAYVSLRNWKKIIPRHRGWALENIARFRRLVDKHSDFLGWTEPEGGLVAFPCFKDAKVENGEAFLNKLVEKRGVSMLPGEAFEMPGYFRIGFGVKPEVFDEAMNHLSAFIENREWV